jgi:hypothetical protein
MDILLALEVQGGVLVAAEVEPAVQHYMLDIQLL